MNNYKNKGKIVLHKELNELLIIQKPDPSLDYAVLAFRLDKVLHGILWKECHLSESLVDVDLNNLSPDHQAQITEYKRRIENGPLRGVAFSV